MHFPSSSFSALPTRTMRYNALPLPYRSLPSLSLRLMSKLCLSQSVRSVPLHCIALLHNSSALCGFASPCPRKAVHRLAIASLRFAVPSHLRTLPLPNYAELIATIPQRRLPCQTVPFRCVAFHCLSFPLRSVPVNAFALPDNAMPRQCWALLNRAVPLRGFALPLRSVAVLGYASAALVHALLRLGAVMRFSAVPLPSYAELDATIPQR